MGRIEQAYAEKFRQLLTQLEARRVEQGLCWLNSKAHTVAGQTGVSYERALETVYRRIHSQVDEYRARAGKPHRWSLEPAAVKFVCDAGLGGLARWLRASGYEARWTQNISD